MLITTSNSALIARNLTVSLQKKRILSDISFELNQSESVAILGASGSGKTIFLRSIAGFVKRFESGHILLNNKSVQTKNIFVPPEKRDCVLLFQDLALWPHLTVLEHLNFAQNHARQQSNIVQLLSFFELGRHKNKRPHQLSGGEKQRLALARTLVTKPSLLLLDEPFSSLDLVLKAQMIQLLKKLKSEFSFSLVHVTHDINEAAHIADKIALFDNGQIYWQGYVREFFQSNSPKLNAILAAQRWMSSKVNLSGVHATNSMLHV